MTAFHLKGTLTRLWGNRLAFAMIFGILSLGMALPVQAQNQTEGQQEEAQETQEAETADQNAPSEALVDNEKKKPVKRLYLGPRPQVKKSKGPSAGKPLSIRPEPFVTPGSLTIRKPEPEEVQAAADDPFEALFDGVRKPADDVSDQSQIISDGNPFEKTEILAADLEAIDPSVQGIGNTIQDPDFWAGYDHRTAAKVFAHMARVGGHGPMGTMLRSMARQPITLSSTPEPSVIPGRVSPEKFALLRSRLALFAALGDGEAYSSLLSSLPMDQDWSGLAQEQLNDALIRGDLAGACRLSSDARGKDDDPFWLRVAVMCAAARGDRTALDFNLSVLEEVSAVGEDFYALSDMLLIEGETSADGPDGGAILGPPLGLDSLSVHMARLARSRVEHVDTARMTPIGLSAALTLKELSPTARDQIFEAASRAGLLRSGHLLGYLADYEPSEDQLASVFIDAPQAGGFGVDLTLLYLSGDQDALYGDRARALEASWERAVRLGRTSGVAGALSDLGGDLPARGNAVDAYRIRAALLAGDMEQASSLLAAIRTTGNMDRPDVADALVRLAPVMAVSGVPGAPKLTVDLFRRWWQLEKDKPDAVERGALLLTVAEGLGRPIQADHWMVLEESDRAWATERRAAPTLLWRGLVQARGQKDRPAVLQYASALLAAQRPEDMSAAMAGSLLNSLCSVGFCTTGKAVSVDLLIRAGF